MGPVRAGTGERGPVRRTRYAYGSRTHAPARGARLPPLVAGKRRGRATTLRLSGVGRWVAVRAETGGVQSSRTSLDGDNGNGVRWRVALRTTRDAPITSCSPSPVSARARVCARGDAAARGACGGGAAAGRSD